MTDPQPPPPPPHQVPIALPSMADLATAEHSLANLVARKKAIDKSIASLEANIYALEGSYLEDTLGYGNIILGFDNYMHARPADKKQTGRPHGPTGGMRWDATERIFSGSSYTFQKALELKNNPDDDDDPLIVPSYHQQPINSIPKKKKSVRRIDDFDD